jgi:hypothetical protein
MTPAKRSTPFHLAVWACALVLFRPARFRAFEAENTEPLGIPAASNRDSVFLVRRAFWTSLLLVIGSGIVGALAGLVAGYAIGAVSARAIAWMQVIGACLLLWGTLFVRGWELQTYKGLTLVERVNQWLYRGLYCAGTAVLVASVALPSR